MILVGRGHRGGIYCDFRSAAIIIFIAPSAGIASQIWFISFRVDAESMKCYRCGRSVSNTTLEVLEVPAFKIFSHRNSIGLDRGYLSGYFLYIKKS